MISSGLLRSTEHNVRVFGSVARGEASPTRDIDLMKMERGRSLLDLIGLSQQLESSTAKWTSSLMNVSALTLSNAIHAEAVPLWKDVRIYLLHIRDAIQHSLQYTASGKESFFADRKTQNAVVRNLEIIDEATKRVSTSI